MESKCALLTCPVSIPSPRSRRSTVFFFFNDTATTEIYTLSLHDALPISATQLVFSVEPSTTSAGAAITPAVQVTALDASNNTATGFTGNVTVAIGTNPGSGTLAGTATVAASAGVATFANLSI